jgi:hypothetical protein
MYPIAIDKVSDVLGGRKVLGRAVRTFDELAAAIAIGLPREVVAEIARHAAPEGERARIAGLVTSPATFKRSPRLSPQASERAERRAKGRGCGRGGGPFPPRCWRTPTTRGTG